MSLKVKNAKCKMKNEKSKFKENVIQRLICFSIRILKLGEKIRKKRILWPIIDQIVKSATSIGANIIEAKASSSKRDYLRFFEIALNLPTKQNIGLF